MRRQLFWLLALLVTSHWLAAPVAADQCSSQCDAPVGCYGSCSISMPSCGVFCIDTGCSVSCKSIGLKCEGGGDTVCTQKPPTNSAPVAPAAAGWAVLRYPARAAGSIDPSEVTALHASSAGFADFARAETARRHSQQTLPADRQAGTAAKPAPVDERQEETLLVVPRGICTTVQAELAQDSLAGAGAESPQTVYFVTTTDGTGRIVSLEVLYSDANDADTARIVDFGKQNLKLRAPNSPGKPLEVYGFLRAADGQVGYMIEAGSSPASR
jgi:hypothetical protein